MREQSADISVAGFMFAAPIYRKWAVAYQKSAGAKVNYQGIGSRGGFKQLMANIADFASSDAPMRDDELSKAGLFQFPTVVGGVSLLVDLPGKGDLTLYGEVLGDIYLGKIKKWNASAIVGLNPNTNCRISTSRWSVVLIDLTPASSGRYLSQVNQEWKSKLGEGATVNWPFGIVGC